MNSLLLDFLYRDSIVPQAPNDAFPTHNSLPPTRSQTITPPFINQYEDLDKLKKGMDMTKGRVFRLYSY